MAQYRINCKVRNTILYSIVRSFRVTDEIEALKAILLDDELSIKENDR